MMNSKIDLDQFPVTEYLDSICSTLKNSESHALVLTAETGAGKSTILPLGLLKNFEGKMIMTEPRRLAVLGVSSRVAELYDCEIGQEVGYKIHLENKISDKTRLEVLTEAVLVRMLQDDPSLEDYNLVVLDEFHERSVNTDLALAFLKEAMELREDLYVIVMSATIDSKKIAEYLGKEKSAPVISIPGKMFPVEVKYDGKTDFIKICESEAEKSTGDILIFLPGISEIKKCEEKLKENLDLEQYEILILHSSISLNEQKKILTKNESHKKRIIISSAIAETSITVPGITTVIDCGLSRVNRLNLNTGIETLCTENESQFSADQRKGRAGRLKAGKCVRTWNEFDPRIKTIEPEILRSDLSSLVLECAERGIYDLHKIDWLDSPSESNWKTSRELLENLECISEKGRITEKGKKVLQLGIGVRLGCIALVGNQENLVLKYSNYAKSSNETQLKFVKNLNKKLQNLSKFEQNSVKNDEIPQNLKEKFAILEGFPDRAACRISSKNAEKVEYQFSFGRKAYLKNCKNAPKWICATEVLNINNESIIFEFEEIPDEFFEIWVKKHLKEVEICEFHEGKVEKFQQICFGKIVISSKKIPARNEDYAKAWLTGLKKNGIKSLPFDEKSEKFLQKVKFFNQQRGIYEANSLEKELEENGEKWLIPFINNDKKLNSQTVFDALYWYLNGAEIEKSVPEILILPNGNKAKIKYELQTTSENRTNLIIRPVCEIIIQRAFGCNHCIEILGMKVLFRLLSPAQRPLQITEDLENFWTGAWPEICKEMKGRYPKHNWDKNIIVKDKE